MKQLLIACLIFASSPFLVSAEDSLPGSMLPLSAPGGWAMLEDAETLIVSQPDSGELIYFNTSEEAETKRVSVDFRPGAMARQGDVLYVGVVGGAVLYALDAESGRQKKEISLEGASAVSMIACHPTKGLIYVSTKELDVFSIDPKSGTSKMTKAVGDFLVVDPVSGNSVYTGVQPDLSVKEIFVRDLPGGNIEIFFDRWGRRAFILKYNVTGKDLKLASAQDNAAVNAYLLSITPDGKKVTMTSGGGWRPLSGSGGGYMSAAFSTTNLETRAGEFPSGTSIVFHPVLNIGFVNQVGRDLQFFNTKSMVQTKKYHFSDAGEARPLLATFGGKGTKVVIWNGDNPEAPTAGLHFLSIPLTETEKASLVTAYGKLPESVNVATKEDPPSEEPEPKTTTKTKTTTEKTESSTESEGSKITLPKGTIAVAGFNDAKGLNSTSAPKAPYTLGSSNVRGGGGEPGWQGVWPASDKVKFIKEDVGEGDGAVHLTATVNYGRQLAKPQKKAFTIEMMFRCPDGGGFHCYIWDKQVDTTGPFFRVREGKVSALEGNLMGAGNFSAVGDFEYDKWNKLKVTIDPENQTWKIALNDEESDKEFKFRTDTKTIQGINFLVEENQQIELDAIKILEVEAPKE